MSTCKLSRSNCRERVKVPFTHVLSASRHNRAARERERNEFNFFFHFHTLYTTRGGETAAFFGVFGHFIEKKSRDVFFFWLKTARCSLTIAHGWATTTYLQFSFGWFNFDSFLRHLSCVFLLFAGAWNLEPELEKNIVYELELALRLALCVVSHSQKKLYIKESFPLFFSTNIHILFFSCSHSHFFSRSLFAPPPTPQKLLVSRRRRHIIDVKYPSRSERARESEQRRET